ncbi:MAG: YjjG family noncanonical pyrimidine nucleotidase [Erysipelotrichaceae bacterium]
MNYTTILFDADETLLDFKAGERIAFQTVCEAANLSYNEEVVKSYQTINKALWTQLEQGCISKDEVIIGRYEQLFERYQITMDARDASEIFFASLASCAALLPEAYELCVELAQTHQLYIVTNGVKQAQLGRLQASGLLGLFDGVFISEEIGAAKPQPAFFEHVLAHIEEKDRRKLLLVGDSMASDIVGGHNMNIDTCWYHPVGSEESQIQTPTYEIQCLGQLRTILSNTAV